MVINDNDDHSECLMRKTFTMNEWMNEMKWNQIKSNEWNNERMEIDKTEMKLMDECVMVDKASDRLWW